MTEEPDARDRLLAALERQLSEFHRRSAHREAVIDRLHEENRVLREGLRRSILDPVVADLFRLHDALLGESARLADEPAGPNFAGFADETEIILDRCGMEVFVPRPGDPFEPNRQTPVTVVPTGDPALHNTVERVLSTGFTERETGRIRRTARVRVWRFERSDDLPEEHIRP
uniref:nucleotide exchange factor GrpE n=1 Tax=Herbidospora sakaeratensis TaxID=564415 RepID=UPI000785E2BC|nr:nucleotide exchange factor GrpE [Herbidospora sakaeratensis]